MNRSIKRRRELLDILLPAPKDPVRLSPLLQAPLGQSLRRFVSSVWKVWSGNGSIPSTSPANVQAPGSSFARTLEQEFSIGGYIPGVTWVRRVTRRRLREEGTDLRREGEERIRAADPDELFPALKALQTPQCPFKNLPEKRASRWGESLTAEKMDQCRWVKPKLVCQVAFVEWTDARRLRHCTFVAMRDDKRPAQVVRET